MFSLSQSLGKAGSDPKLLLLSIMVFLSYLPEAGQYSCFFLYLRQVREREKKGIFSSLFKLCSIYRLLVLVY